MRGRVLYIEDHDYTRVLMGLMLRTAGFDVTEATCARDALELARSTPFDLYLLDHTFPGRIGRHPLPRPPRVRPRHPHRLLLGSRP